MVEAECKFGLQEIPIQEFLKLSGVVSDYLRGDKKLQPFISTYCSLGELEKNIEARKNFNFREELVTVLQHQNKHCKLNQRQKENIAALAHETTYCITTAHQTNLLGGPLYFIQKAVSAIVICQQAKEHYPDCEFIPIYWLGSEDHDFEELNHTHVFGETITWEDEQGGAVGRYSTSSLEPLIEQVNSLFSTTKNDEYLKDVFKKYLAQPTVADSTRYLLNELLGEYGLVVIDGDDETLKQKVVPIFEKELTEQFSYNASKKAVDFLEQEYGKSQAHPREINLFYLTEKSRKRIVKVGNNFTLYGTTTSFTKEEILKELNEYPTRFSPNVMLRPLMQEICLPNLLYVGGGGEMSYWFQLKPIFDAVGCAFPMLGLRDTAVYLSKKSQHKLQKLHLQVADFVKPKHELTHQFVKENTTNELTLTQAKQLLEQVTELLHSNAMAVDKSLDKSAKASQQKIMNELHKFEKKLLRAEKSNQTIRIRQLEAIYSEIYPKGKLQERLENFSQYYSVYGKGWIEWQLKHFNLFSKTVKVCLFDYD